MTEKTHYRKAFDSPYLSSADIVDPIILTIEHVALEPDRTNKSKELFNTAYFVEKEIRPGEKLKPMILNVANSKTMKELTDSPFIDDWSHVKVTVFVDKNVKFGRDIVEGLRISGLKSSRKILVPEMVKAWANAKVAYKRDGNLNAVFELIDISEENQKRLIDECKLEMGNDIP